MDYREICFQLSFFWHCRPEFDLSICILHIPFPHMHSFRSLCVRVPWGAVSASFLAVAWPSALASLWFPRWVRTTKPHLFLSTADDALYSLYHAISWWDIVVYCPPLHFTFSLHFTYSGRTTTCGPHIPTPTAPVPSLERLLLPFWTRDSACALSWLWVAHASQCQLISSYATSCCWIIRLPYKQPSNRMSVDIS